MAGEAGRRPDAELPRRLQHEGPHEREPRRLGDWSDGGGAKIQTPGGERTCAVGRRDDGVAAVARTCGDDVVGRRLSDRDACSLTGARKGGQVRRIGRQQRRSLWREVVGEGGICRRRDCRRNRRAAWRYRARERVVRLVASADAHDSVVHGGLHVRHVEVALELELRGHGAAHGCDRRRVPVQHGGGGHRCGVPHLRLAGSAPSGPPQIPPPSAIASKATAVAAIIRQDRNIAPPPIVGESLVRDSATTGWSPAIAPLGESAGECSN